jgi:hypothetical protein
MYIVCRDTLLGFNVRVRCRYMLLKFNVTCKYQNSDIRMGRMLNNYIDLFVTLTIAWQRKRHEENMFLEQYCWEMWTSTAKRIPNKLTINSKIPDTICFPICGYLTSRCYVWPDCSRIPADHSINLCLLAAETVPPIDQIVKGAVPWDFFSKLFLLTNPPGLLICDLKQFLL